jgi:phosphoribosyl 1,2-cyclic phosphodiesterase
MLRYGGNTTCAAVRVGDTHIVLDAGTGLRGLGDALLNDPDPPRHIVLLITHTHWDHIIGFPFFTPLFEPHTRLEIYGLQRTQASLRTTIANALSDPLLPIGFEDLRADLHFHEINGDGVLALGEDVLVQTAQVNHPYRALGYRIESAHGTLCFIPDTGPFHTVLFGDERVAWNGTPVSSSVDLKALEQMRSDVVRLAAGADWLIYDAQFTEEQYLRFPHWGHSSYSQALEIAEESAVQHLLFFHHDPHRTDEELDREVAEQQRQTAKLRVHAAYEGMHLSRERPL